MKLYVFEPDKELLDLVTFVVMSGNDDSADKALENYNEVMYKIYKENKHYYSVKTFEANQVLIF